MADGQVWRKRWSRRSVVVAATVGALVASGLGSVRPAFAEGALADPAVRKPAAKCQALIAKSTAKALDSKLKAFKDCAGAALACVQSKSDKADCDTKAAATCTKKLGSAVAAATKAKGKILADKNCVALSPTDLLGSDGLGFGDIAGPCAVDFGINVCDGLAPIADCLMTSHDRNAGALFSRGLPRMSDLLARLPGAPFTDAAGVSSPAGCGSCNAPGAAQKSVEKCGKALGAGTQGVAKALEDAFGKCTLELYDCAQLEDSAAACVSKASTGCSKATTKITKAVSKLETAATKGCSVDFAAASAANGLNLGALATRCAALGVPTLDAPNAFATCLAAESRCAVAALVQSALPRTAEFLAAAQVGGLATALGATCPALAPLTTATARATGHPRAIFGSILKIVKSVRRTVPSGVGVRAPGGKPKTYGTGTAAVSKAQGPKKVTFGQTGKYTVTYSRGVGSIGRGSEQTPPSLIVAVTRSDIVFDDHFEIPLLPAPAGGAPVDDEIDIEFGDSIPACAFDLNFATKTDDAISDYQTLPQVVEETVTTTVGPELVSRGPAGVQQDGATDVANVAISADGRYVAFTSRATNLVTPSETNGISDVYVRDRCVANGVPISSCTPATTLESFLPGGEPFVHDGAAGRVAISDDGRYVGFDVTLSMVPDPITRSFVKDRCLSNGQPVAMCSVAIQDVSFDPETGDSTGRLTSLSTDGRFVVLTSTTTYGDGVPRVFLLDRCVSTSSDPVYPFCEPFPDLISRNSLFGGEPNGDSDFGVVSRKGRFVAFRSNGSDILAPRQDMNGANDVFVEARCLDPATGSFFPGCVQETTRINIGPGGTESAGDDPLSPPLTNIAISDDGRYVAFSSTAADLLGAGLDTNSKRDVFVHDRCVNHDGPILGCTPSNERVNIGPGGTESNGAIAGGFALAMSASGRFVAFASDATNLLGSAVGMPNGTFQIFLRDRCLDGGVPLDGCTPSTTIVSTAADGGLGTASSDRPAIAAGGSATAFVSAAANLLGPGVDANNLLDVFVRDR